MKEAKFYTKRSQDIICNLCPHNCIIKDGHIGICRQKKNQNGILKVRGYGNISSIALDPIEKKPLYHFLPGENIFSIGGIGCNFKCSFCQNWQIAHEDIPARYIAPEKIVDEAIRYNSLGIAYTYNEPIIGYEYVYDTAKLARERGLKNVLVTNGFINNSPLERILPYIDAMNIDLKAFDDKFYRNICAGRLSPVKETIKTSVASCHVEITTLIINGLNDSEDEIEDLSKWLADIDTQIPLHLSRYYPNYQMDIPKTSRDTMLKLANIAKRYLHFVYIGNMAGVDNNTYCPKCRNTLVERGYKTRIIGLEDGKCINCALEFGKNLR